MPELRPEAHPGSTPNSLALSPDGKQLVTGTMNCTILFWDWQAKTHLFFERSGDRLRLARLRSNVAAFQAQNDDWSEATKAYDEYNYARALEVTELLEVAKEAYDIVIVDTSPFFYGPMLALLEPTDQLFMLCGLDVPTLKNVKLSLQTLEQLGFPMSRTELVLNRVAPKVGLSREDVEETLGMKVSYEIPNDPVVAPSVNRGAAAVLLEPESEFAAAIAALAAAADPVGATPAAALANTSKRRWLTPARRLLEGRSS
jgi:hypothetical protein